MNVITLLSIRRSEGRSSASANTSSLRHPETSIPFLFPGTNANGAGFLFSRHDVQPPVDRNAFVLAFRTAGMIALRTKSHITLHDFFQKSPKNPMFVAMATHHRVLLALPQLEVRCDKRAIRTGRRKLPIENLERHAAT